MNVFSKIATVVFILICTPGIEAQMPGGATGMNTALLKLFGKNNNFSLKADMRMLVASKELMSLKFDMAVLNGKLRVDVDVADAKGDIMTPEQIAQMKAMRMDRSSSILRPDKNLLYVVYPGLKAYAEVPLPKETATALSKTPKTEKIPIGKETLDGHPCTKNKVILTDPQGQKEEFFTWEATDLKDFPIQVQLVEGGKQFIFRYRDLRFSLPDSKLFEPPQGFTKFDPNDGPSQPARKR